MKKKLIFAYLYDSPSSQLTNVDFSQIDVLNYSFGVIKNNKLSIDHLRYFSEALDLKNQGLKIVLSIGGWGADGFSDAALNPTSRKEFIDSIISVVNEYRLDGIDLDWEYPGIAAAKIVARAEDTVNFTLLLTELRKALPEKILTIAVGAGQGIANKMEIAKIAKLIDFLHIMTYDLGGFRKLAFTHNSNLYPSVNNPHASATLAVEIYEKDGFPRNRMVIGAAFYGKAGKLNEAFVLEKSTFAYHIIKKDYFNKMTYYFDDVAKAAILYNDDWFISYEDPQALKAKIEYINALDLAGIMFWQLASDNTGELLAVIANNLNK